MLTIYRSGLRGIYGLYSTKKHGFRTKKHEKARKMRQKTDAFAFGMQKPQVRVLSLRPNLTNSNVRNSKRIVNGLVRFFFILEQCGKVIRIGNQPLELTNFTYCGIITDGYHFQSEFVRKNLHEKAYLHVA